MSPRIPDPVDLTRRLIAFDTINSRGRNGLAPNPWPI